MPTIMLSAILSCIGCGARPVFPENLVWVCAYSDAGVECTDTVFSSPAIVDCGNHRPLTAYEGGSGVMTLTNAAGEAVTYWYESRSYSVRGGPGNQDVVQLFPNSTDGFEFPMFRDSMEAVPCQIYQR